MGLLKILERWGKGSPPGCTPGGLVTPLYLTVQGRRYRDVARRREFLAT